MEDALFEPGFNVGFSESEAEPFLSDTGNLVFLGEAIDADPMAAQ